MKIIALETSTQPGSIAAIDDGHILCEQHLPTSKKTAESFAAVLQQMLSDLGWSANTVDAIAVCEGPGSFTGLRIGVTVAKTFAYATGAKIVAPSTMRVLATQANATAGDDVWCVMDAQRGEIFASVYRNDASIHRFVEVEPTRIYSPADWYPKLQTGQVVIGNGLRRLDQQRLSDVIICTESPHAGSLATVASEMLTDGETANSWKLVPKYYRKSAAEEKRVGS